MPYNKFVINLFVYYNRYVTKDIHIAANLLALNKIYLKYFMDPSAYRYLCIEAYDSDGNIHHLAWDNGK